MELVCGDDHKPAGAGRDEAEFLMLDETSTDRLFDLKRVRSRSPVEKQG